MTYIFIEGSAVLNLGLLEAAGVTQLRQVFLFPVGTICCSTFRVSLYGEGWEQCLVALSPLPDFTKGFAQHASFGCDYMC